MVPKWRSDRCKMRITMSVTDTSNYHMEGNKSYVKLVSSLTKDSGLLTAPYFLFCIETQTAWDRLIELLQYAVWPRPTVCYATLLWTYASKQTCDTASRRPRLHLPASNLSRLRLSIVVQLVAQIGRPWTFHAAVLCLCKWTHHQHIARADSWVSPLYTLWWYELKLSPVGVYHPASLWRSITDVRIRSAADEYLIQIRTEEPHQTQQSTL